MEQKASYGRGISPPSMIRFGAFELDLQAAELRKNGHRIRLQEQPFQILVELLERPGEVVSREEIRNKLWPNNTVVEFDHSINAAVKRLRDVLQDSPESPQYIETLSRRGYRLMVPVSREQEIASLPGVAPLTATPATIEEGLTAAAPDPADGEISPVPPHKSVRRFVVPRWMLMFGVVILAAGAGFFGYRRASTHRTVAQRTLTRLTFDDGLQTEPTWSPDGSLHCLQFRSGRKVRHLGTAGKRRQSDTGHQTSRPELAARLVTRWQIHCVSFRGGGWGNIRDSGLRGCGTRTQDRNVWLPSPVVAGQLAGVVRTSILLSLVNRFYIAQLDGSPPREVLAEFLAQKKLSASAAAWYPDGKKITVWVADSSPTPSFWTIPIAGGPGIKLEIAAAVQKELAQASGDSEAGQQLGEYSFSWSPSGDAIYFERGYREARNIWKLHVDPEALRATSIDRLTTGPGPDAGAAVSKDGKRLAFSAKSQRIQTWLFPFDARAGQIKGDGTAITSPGRTSIDPDISRDGMNVAYYVPHGETGGLGVRVRRPKRSLGEVTGGWERGAGHRRPGIFTLVSAVVARWYATRL